MEMSYFVCKSQMLIFPLVRSKDLGQSRWFVCCPTPSAGFIGAWGEIHVGRLVIERYLK